MSQEVNLSGLSVSPLELDEKERVFESEGQWVEWVRFTREISEGADEKTRCSTDIEGATRRHRGLPGGRPQIPARHERIPAPRDARARVLAAG